MAYSWEKRRTDSLTDVWVVWAYPYLLELNWLELNQILKQFGKILNPALTWTCFFFLNLTNNLLQYLEYWISTLRKHAMRAISIFNPRY